MTPLENKYTKWYFNIVNMLYNIPCNTYTEKHHIIPRSLDGSNDADNLVKLTAKQHFICHKLLTKMFKIGTNEYYKMLNAFCMMSWCTTVSNQTRYTSIIYNKYRKEYSEYMSARQLGEGNNQYGTTWVYCEELKQNKKIYKGEPVPSGWEKGRIIKWDEYFLQKERKRLLSLQHTFISSKSLDTLKQSVEYTHKCNVCSSLYSSIKPKSTYCGSKCSNSFRIKNPRIITLYRDNQYKEVKAQNVPAYKKCGWLPV